MSGHNVNLDSVDVHKREATVLGMKMKVKDFLDKSLVRRYGAGTLTGCGCKLLRARMLISRLPPIPRWRAKLRGRPTCTL